MRTTITFAMIALMIIDPNLAKGIAIGGIDIVHTLATKIFSVLFNISMAGGK